MPDGYTAASDRRNNSIGYKIDEVLGAIFNFERERQFALSGTECKR